jgi:hypothetical protein
MNLFGPWVENHKIENPETCHTEAGSNYGDIQLPMNLCY